MALIQRMRSGKWAALRVAGRMGLVFLVASALVFAAVQAMPEDPVALRVKNPNPERIAEVRAALGLDDPWPQRFAHYIVDFASGDWGSSLVSGRPVREEVAAYLPATVELGVLAVAVGTCLGLVLVLGSEAVGWRWMRKLAGGLAAMGLTVPIYWVGLLLVVAFAVQFGWLPVSGRYDFTMPPPAGSGFYLIDTLARGDVSGFVVAARHLVLPVMTLALYPAALVAGVLRGRLSDPRIGKLVIALRAKGLNPAHIWGSHILRLMAPSVVTMIGTNVGGLMGGAVLTETVFSWPGMGRFLVDGVLNRDVFIIANGLLLAILLAFAVASVTDLLARRLDPVAWRAERRGTDS